MMTELMLSFSFEKEKNKEGIDLYGSIKFIHPLLILNVVARIRFFYFKIC